MLEDLQNYYANQGILSTHFTCKHLQQCGANCSEFTGPKSAFVSTGYEEGSLPRLLFLSLDSGSGDKIDSNRLADAVRQYEEFDRDLTTLVKNRHWYRTHELAWYILQRFDPKITLEEARKYFAHANSAKCCMNLPQRKKAERRLFKNCQEYLKGELQILCPDIIVTQGNEAKEGIQSLKPEVITQFDLYAATIKIDGRIIFWLHTYHPNNWGVFNRQRSFNKDTQQAQGWIKYAELIKNEIGRIHNTI